MQLANVKADQIQTMGQVIDLMIERMETFQKSGDHRAVFQRVYLLMTKEMQRRLESGFFRDPVWMERVLVGFAHYYFAAIDAYEAGQPCPPAWELAFRLADQKHGFVLQDALLGINAHINSDLPMVLYKILAEDNAWPDARIMLHRRYDHERINDVLADLVDLVQDELAKHHARFLYAMDLVMGRRDERLSAFILTHCRIKVWYNTELLLDAADEQQRDLLRRHIEQDAYAIGLKLTNSRVYRAMRGIAPLTRKVRWF